MAASYNEFEDGVVLVNDTCMQTNTRNDGDKVAKCRWFRKAVKEKQIKSVAQLLFPIYVVRVTEHV